MNWGFNIGAFYIFFVVVMLTTVLILMKHDVGLVTNDYYAKEIAYQEQIDKTNRTKELTEQLEINVEREYIKFSFPKMFGFDPIGGTIHFYRPSDKQKDFTKKIDLDSYGIQLIETGKLEKGLWKIKIDWNVRNNSYFNEQIFMVN